MTRTFEVGTGLICDVDKLITSRLKIQANSGAGKVESALSSFRGEMVAATSRLTLPTNKPHHEGSNPAGRAATVEAADRPAHRERSDYNAGGPRSKSALDGAARTGKTLTTSGWSAAKPVTGLTASHQKILDALAWFESLGIDKPEKVAVAAMAGYAASAGRYGNLTGELRSRGMVEYYGDNTMSLTDLGRRAARHPDRHVTENALHERVLSVLDPSERKLMAVILRVYPHSIGSDRLAAETGYAPEAGRFSNLRGRLKTLGLVEYKGAGQVRARDVLFPESRR